MNINVGYKQKHHFSNGGGAKAKRAALLDITVDAKANNSQNYASKEKLVVSGKNYSDLKISI